MRKKTKMDEEMGEQVQKKQKEHAPINDDNKTTNSSYYYDDACGYEIYVDESEDEKLG